MFDLRIEYPGAVYHLTSRGNARRSIFANDNARIAFFKVLAQAIDRFNWICHAYCLMNNHYHLLVETVDPTLSRGMRHLNGVYTQRFNRRHSSAGHVFQGRYKAILVEKEPHLLELARYIVLNPVRSKAVRNCRDWHWSSYRATAGFEPATSFLTTDWLLSQFDSSPDAAQLAYRRFVSEGRTSPIWDNLRGQVYLGSDTFIEQHIPEGSRAFREIPREQRLVDRPSLRDLFASSAEDDAITTAYRRHGYRLNEIASFLGVHYSTVSRRLKKLEAIMNRDI